MGVTIFDMSPPSSIALGCSVAVVSSALQSLGITLQRRSHLLPIHLGDESTDNPQTHHQYSKLQRNTWLFGFFLFIVSNVLGSLIQITTLPLIILSPLQSIGLIFNSLLSCLLLPGETFTWKLGVGTLIISTGAFIIAYHGNAIPPPPDSDIDVDKRFKIIIHKLIDPRFMAWFISSFVLIGLLLLANSAITYKRNKFKNRIQQRSSRSTTKALEKLKFFKGVNYGLISGTLTAHTFLFAKSLIDVVVESIFAGPHDVGSITRSITPYFLLIVMLTIVGCQLTAFNLGLAQISSSILYPLCFLVYNLMNLINDLTFNHLLANQRLTIGQLFWVLLGLCAVLFGVVLISWDSAVGSNVQRLAYDNEEEYILHSKFPYTDNLNEMSKMVDSSSTYEMETGYLSIDSTHLNPHGPYPLSTRRSAVSTRNKKRVLSYEQQQLLQQFETD